MNPMFSALDVRYKGHPNVIASCLLEGGDGAVLIDPGPTASLDGLRAALAGRSRQLADIDAILLTHIHLDHAGATGTILRNHPRIQVYVHERGAPHVIDPGKLLQSASRLYGDRLHELWGEVAPVPEANVHVLRGGECLDLAGRRLQVAYTPGHASHHVSYFDPATRTAFVGDTAGIRMGLPLFVAAPTPPPDVDLDGWQESFDRIRAWQPERLFLTHFGPFTNPAEHLAELEARIRHDMALVEAGLADASLDDAHRMAVFAREARAAIASRIGDAAADAYALAIPFEHCWMGLARYVRKQTADHGRRS